ncbi:MAG: YbhB/YbcL family Raf kinase inhibitor-like protein [Verrucomicrobiia bacterium]|jgi:Raf kinase inhibitor-like YbhB/YbcL family protein
MKRSVFVVAIIMMSGCAFAHAEGMEATVAQFTFSSPSFRNKQPMPAKHSCEGEDASPALKWEGAPAGTKSFALIADDPDAPGGTWVHWVAYAIPASATELPESIAQTDTIAAPAGLKQGMNDFGRVGYGGPCPPRGHGVHHYYFRLYALDAELNLAPGVKRHQLDAAMKGHILAQTELVGTYQRD